VTHVVVDMMSCIVSLGKCLMVLVKIEVGRKEGKCRAWINVTKTLDAVMRAVE
jgi:hypothetical protein